MRPPTASENILESTLTTIAQTVLHSDMWESRAKRTLLGVNQVTQGSGREEGKAWQLWKTQFEEANCKQGLGYSV